MICICAVYANGPGKRFDGDYYLTTHARLAESLLSPLGLQELRVTIGIRDLAGGPPPYCAISEMVFASREAFDLAMAACGEALFRDAKNYTDIEPILQLSTLHPTFSGGTQ